MIVPTFPGSVKLSKTTHFPYSKLNDFGWLIGNEAHGASKEVIETADKKIYIPIKGKAESLNAAVAAGIMIYHFS